MESNQSFVDNMSQWIKHIDDMFPPECDREDVYTLLRFYIMMDKLKTRVKRSGLVMFKCGCGLTCGGVGCGKLIMGSKIISPPII